MNEVTSGYTAWLTNPGTTWLDGTKYSANYPSSQGYWCSAVEFNFDNGGYKYYSQACYVDIYCGSEYIGTLSWTGAQGQRLNQTMSIPYSTSRVGQQLHYTMTQSGFRNVVAEVVTVSSVPYRTSSQSSIASVTAVDKTGDSCIATMNAPSWINATGGSQITQWFCSTSSTYSDSWHVGDTSGSAGSSQSFTFTKAMLTGKGATPGTTMYLYCRTVYYKDGSYYGQNADIWSYVSYTGTYVYRENYHKTVKYYTNGSWVECIPHVYTNGSFIEVEPYIYKNGAWVLCTHS